MVAEPNAPASGATMEGSFSATSPSSSQQALDAIRAGAEKGLKDALGQGTDVSVNVGLAGRRLEEAHPRFLAQYQVLVSYTVRLATDYSGTLLEAASVLASPTLIVAVNEQLQAAGQSPVNAVTFTAPEVLAMGTSMLTTTPPAASTPEEVEPCDESPDEVEEASPCEE